MFVIIGRMGGGFAVWVQWRGRDANSRHIRWRKIKRGGPKGGETGGSGETGQTGETGERGQAGEAGKSGGTGEGGKIGKGGELEGREAGER